jgi:putative glutamine amidotransferase
MSKTIFIGITDSETAYDNYPAWIKGSDTAIEIIRLRPDNLDDVHRCAAIVLSGGIDTHPKFYNNHRINYPNAPEMLNTARDEFEIQTFQLSGELGLPLLAICRGMQLVNICLGGTLIQDLEESRKANHRKQNGQDGIHEIIIETGSLVHELSKMTTNMVNSAHHQGLDKIADDLYVTAWSPDGVPEAVERRSASNNPFFLGVQWHPERFEQTHPNHSFTQNIRQQLLDAAKNKSYANY